MFYFENCKRGKKLDLSHKCFLIVNNLSKSGQFAAYLIWENATEAKLAFKFKSS